MCPSPQRFYRREADICLHSINYLTPWLWTITHHLTSGHELNLSMHVLVSLVWTMAMMVAEFSHFLSCVKTFDVTHSWQEWRDISFSSSSIRSQKCACVQSKVIFCDKPCKNIHRDQRFCHGILAFGTKETFQMQVCDADCDWESVMLHHMQY